MALSNHYDICLVGTGAAGGILAYYLTKAGMNVIAIEKGRSVKNEDFENVKLPYERLNFGLTKETKFPVNHHFFTREYGDALRLYAKEDENSVSSKFKNTFKNVQVFAEGGKTNYWNAVSLRFSERDFKAKSYGEGEIDWPLSYSDLEPHYTAVEKLVGVVGSYDKIKEYPDGHFIEPEPLLTADRLFLKGVRSLKNRDLKVIRTRKAVETRENKGNTCEHCGICVKGCTNGSRFSFSKRLLPEIENYANFSILHHHGVKRFHLNESKTKISSAEVLDTRSNELKKIYADKFILCSGTLETPRILFNSSLDDPTRGIANSSGVLGKYLMDNSQIEIYGLLAGLLGCRLREQRQYSSRLLIPRFVYDSSRYRGGFLMDFHHFLLEVPLFLENFPSLPFGLKKILTQMIYPATCNLLVFASCEARASNKVSISANDLDRYGIPQLKVHYELSENDKKLVADMKKWGHLLMKKAGGILLQISENEAGSGIHYAGTCRMSADPRHGIVDANLRSHDIFNLYVCDGSVFPSLPEKNMTLTIMALAKRLSQHLETSVTS